MAIARLFAGRRAAATAIAAASIVVTSAFLVTGDLGRGWDLLGVPRMPPPYRPFADTISVTHAVDCVSMDRDPYADPRCDPWKRLFNYPPLWLEARRFGASRSIDESAGGCHGGVVLGSPNPWPFAPRHGEDPSIVFFSTALLSPAIMFGLERGNVDTLLFSLLTFGSVRYPPRYRDIEHRAALRSHHRPDCPQSLSSCRLRYAHQRPEEFLFGPPVCGRLGIRGVRLDLMEPNSSIFSNTPFTSYYSYVAGALLLEMAAWLDARNIDPIVLRTSATVTALLLGIGVAVWAALGSPRRLRQVLPPLDRRDFADDLCLAGLSIFCLTFLLGSNFNYRLVFLAGALPALIRAFDRSADARVLVAPCAVLALLWATRLPHGVGHALGWRGAAGRLCLACTGACSTMRPSPGA